MLTLPISSGSTCHTCVAGSRGRSAILREAGNGIYVSISKYGSDTPVTRPETDKAGLSSRDRKRGGGKLKCY